MCWDTVLIFTLTSVKFAFPFAVFFLLTTRDVATVFLTQIVCVICHFEVVKWTAGNVNALMS